MLADMAQYRYSLKEMVLKIRSIYKDTIAEIYIGARSLRSVTCEIDALRRQCGQSSDVLTSTQTFLASTWRWNTFPVGVLLRRGAALYGAALLHGRTKFWLPTGVLKAGHLCGRGAAIARSADRPAVLEIAARVLIRNLLAHTVAIRLLRCDLDGTRDEVPAQEVDGRWLLRETRSCISLEGGMEGLMSRLSYKMRRNLGYYRRRAEKELACVFIPQLSPTQSRQAVEVLHRRTDYPIPTALALRYEAALRETPNSFAMGLHDGAGNWLSFLAGWRGEDAIYVEWQLNSMGHDTASLSTVMRAYCLEHETNRGTSQVIFIGGTTTAWSRACVPQICGDLLVVRNGFVGIVTRALARWLRPSGELAEMHGAAVGRNPTKIGRASPWLGRLVPWQAQQTNQEGTP